MFAYIINIIRPMSSAVDASHIKISLLPIPPPERFNIKIFHEDFKYLVFVSLGHDRAGNKTMPQNYHTQPCKPTDEGIIKSVVLTVYPECNDKHIVRYEVLFSPLIITFFLLRFRVRAFYSPGFPAPPAGHW